MGLSMSASSLGPCKQVVPLPVVLVQSKFVFEVELVVQSRLVSVVWGQSMWAFVVLVQHTLEAVVLVQHNEVIEASALGQHILEVVVQHTLEVVVGHILVAGAWACIVRVEALALAVAVADIVAFVGDSLVVLVVWEECT